MAEIINLNDLGKRFLFELGDWCRKQSRFLWVPLLAVFSSTVLLTPIRNYDGLKNLIYGRYLFFFGKLPHHSVFAFGEVKNYVPGDTFDWFGSLIIYSLYHVGSYELTALINVISYTSIILLLLYLVDFEITPLNLLFVFLFTQSLRFKIYVRTAGFALIFVSCLLFCWWKVYYRSDGRYLWGFPVILAVWSNVHGSFLFGFYLVVLLLLGALVEQVLFNRDLDLPWGQCLLVILVTIAAITFVKPAPNYSLFNRGVEVATNITGTVSGAETSTTPEDPEVTRDHWLLQYTQSVFFREDKPFYSSEHRSPLTIPFNFPTQIIFYLFVPLVLLYCLLAGRSVSLAGLLAILATLFLAFSLRRGTPYFPAIALPMVLMEETRLHLLNDLTRRITEVFLGVLNVLAICVLVLLVLAPLLPELPVPFVNSYQQLMERQELRLGKSNLFHRSVPYHLLSQYPDRKVASTPDMGSYLLWEFWPHKKVYIYSKVTAFKDDFLKLQTDLPRLLEDFERRNVSFFVLSREGLVNWREELLQHPSWEFYFKSQYDSMFVFRRTASGNENPNGAGPGETARK